MHSLPSWWVVARREFLERVRSKWFKVVTLLGPVLMIGVIVVPAVLSSHAANKKTKVALISHADAEVTAQFSKTLPEVDSAVELIPTPGDTPEEQLRDRVKARDLTGYLVLPEDILAGGEIKYVGSNATSFEAMGKMETGLEKTIVFARAHRAGMSDEQLKAMLAPLNFKSTTGEKEGGTATFILGYAAMFLLYMAILLYAVSVMRSVIQEKTSRVVEIVISSIKPSMLMAGKIIGVGSVGLVQLVVWVGMSVASVKYRAQLLGAFGVTGSGGWEIPAVGAGTIAVILIYFLLGYFFYSALYAAIGAMCNTDQEAQQAQTPVMMFLVIPVACVNVVSSDPGSSTSRILTMLPFSSPVLMPMRFILGGASIADVAISIAILLVSMTAVIWLAARIYRIGILMYGKRPSLGELARWVRQG